MSTSSWLSTHLLDVHSGNPANGVKVELRYTSSLERAQQFQFETFLGEAFTDINGRISDWITSDDNINKQYVHGSPQIGYYQLKFYIREYFIKQNQENIFWPIISVQFEVTQKDVDSNRHFHVPYLVSNYGLTTYRGSNNNTNSKL